MTANQPTPGRDVLPAGIDVRKIRKPINDAFRSMPIEFTAEGAVTSRNGRGVSISVVGEDLFYLRLTNKTTENGTVKYGWTAVVQDRENGTWENSPRTGNATDSAWATELNNSNLTVGTATRYPARVNPQTGRVTFFQGSGGNGTFTANSSETVLMILGTYDEYKDCPDVPPSPPTVITDVCTGARGTDLCVPAYAYAVYQRCGYVWNKIGDTRTYGVWANEMNGQSFSAWRRFVIPRWGGNFDPSTGLPDPDADCMGVAFLGTGAGSALTCSCPTCLSSPPEGASLCLRFRTIERPEDPAECPGLLTQMDSLGAWNKEYLIPLTPVSGYCSSTGASDDGIFTINMDWQDGFQIDCDWGPEAFDPCDPCEHWGRLYAYIDVPGGNEPNCGGPGHWRGEFKAREVCNLLCDCETGPITPTAQVFCQGCGNNEDPPAVWNVIESGSIELVCCAEPGEIAGMVAWYDAGQNVTTSGGNATSWLNFEGPPNELTNATTGTPRFNLGNSSQAINGQPTITTFRNPSNLYLRRTTSNLLNNGTAATMFTVSRYQGASGFVVFSGAIAATAKVSMTARLLAVSTTPRRESFQAQNSSGTRFTVDGVNMTANTVYLHTGRVNMTANGAMLELRSNGTVYTGTAPSPGTFLNSNGAISIGLRPWDGNDSGTIDQDVAEIIIYDRSLLDWEVSAVEYYLKAKYGLSF